MILRGLAIPFRSVALVGDNSTRELVLPDAFSNMIADGVSVHLQFGSHNDDAPVLASTDDGGMSLFEHAETGLWFEAEIADCDRWAVQSIVRGQHTRASVNFNKQIAGYADHEGHRTRFVASARIDHVAIVPYQLAAYRETAVWPDGPLDFAPAHVRAAAEKWEAAHEAHLGSAQQRADADWHSFCSRADQIVKATERLRACSPGDIQAAFSNWTSLCLTRKRQ